MTASVTIALFVSALAFGAFCAWRGAQPPNLIRGPRMIPYRFLMVLSAAAALLFLVHLVNLMGATTGRSPIG